MSAEPITFIGGCRDGDQEMFDDPLLRLTVAGVSPEWANDTLKALYPPIVTPKWQMYHYRLEGLRCGMEDVGKFYVLEGISTRMALLMLLRGYKRP
jgi:hypothetical protein